MKWFLLAVSLTSVAKFLVLSGGAFFIGAFFTLLVGKIFSWDNKLAKFFALVILNVVTGFMIIIMVGWLVLSVYLSLSIFLAIVGVFVKEDYSYYVGIVYCFVISLFTLFIINLDPIEWAISIVEVIVGIFGIIWASRDDKVAEFISGSALLVGIIASFYVLYYGITIPSIRVLIMDITLSVAGILILIISLASEANKVYKLLGFITFVIFLILGIGDILSLNVGGYSLGVSSYVPIRWGYSVTILILVAVLSFLIFKSLGLERAETILLSSIMIISILSNIILAPLSGETLALAQMAGGAIEERAKVFRSYIQWYKTVQSDPSIRARYLAGSYEPPKEPGEEWGLKELNIEIKDVWFDVEINNKVIESVHIEVYGEIENPLEQSVEITGVKSIVNISFFSSEKENLYSINNQEIDCEYPSSIQPGSKVSFFCTADIPVDANPSLTTDDYNGVLYAVQPNVVYSVSGSSILVPVFVRKEVYDSYLEWKEKGEINYGKLDSVCTRGPVKGVIRARFVGIGEMDKNPIPVPDKGREVELEFYLQADPGSAGSIYKVNTFQFAFPNVNGVEILSTECGTITCNEGTSQDLSNIFWGGGKAGEKIKIMGTEQPSQASYKVYTCNINSMTYTGTGKPDEICRVEVKVSKDVFSVDNIQLDILEYPILFVYNYEYKSVGNKYVREVGLT